MLLSEILLWSLLVLFINDGKVKFTLPNIFLLEMLQLKMLNRIATLGDDGTIIVDVPSDLEAASLIHSAEEVYGEAVEQLVDLADLQYRPPMQVVILIVGTRGDVQPFVAIGKRLQVRSWTANCC